MNQYKEIFLPHPLFRGQLIGSHGTVISSVLKSTGKVKAIRKDKKSGYLTANMPPTWGQPVRQYLHRLVAQVHVPNPLNLPEVNHIDHNKANCRADNLEWVTHRDNIRKAHAFHGNWVDGRKVRKPVIATPVRGGGKPERWDSARAWAISTGNVHRAANVCTALRTGRAAYGFFWAFETSTTTETPTT